MATAAPARTPASHVAVLALLVAAHVATAAFSIMHLDLARDIAQGLAIVRREQLPLAGPLLASSVHMGPLWYYLLALPIAVWPGWLGVALFIAGLSALKYPLAYAFGARLGDARAGLVFALLLAYPGWMTFEVLLQNHASLVATCTLALLLLLHAYVVGGRRPHAAGAGAAFGVALHAHPSTLGLAALLVAAIVVRRHREPGRLLADALVAGLAGAVPFAPYAYDQIARGFPDLARAARFLGDPGLVGEAANTFAILRAMLFGASEVIGRDLVAHLPSFAVILEWTTVALLVAAFAGAAALFDRPRERTRLLVGVAALLVVALSVALVRAPTPYYMTFVVWTLAAGVLALALATATRTPRLRVLAVGALLVALVAGVATQMGAARTLRHGTYTFAFLPLFDVKTPYVRGKPMAFLPARFAGASARLLCGERPLFVHGLYAVHLFHVYAVEARLACGRTAQIRLGGAPGGEHRVGMARGTAEALGVDVLERLGPLVLARPVRVVNRAFDAAVPDPATYPPIAPSYGPGAAHVFEFEADADEAVLVTDAYFAFTAPPAVVAHADGRPRSPDFEERATMTFSCRQCPRERPVRWRIVVTTPAIERVDIVTVRIRGGAA